jgi:hypothetical protein
MKAKRTYKRLGNIAFFLSGAFLIASLVMNLFLTRQASAAGKVNVCHWVEEGKYVSITVDFSTLDTWQTQGQGLHSNDIWAGFTTGDGKLVAGHGDMSILKNGCQIPATSTDTPVLIDSTLICKVSPTPTDSKIYPTCTLKCKVSPTPTLKCKVSPTPT